MYDGLYACVHKKRLSSVAHSPSVAYGASSLSEGALGQGDRRETDWSLGTRRPTRDRVEPWDKETDERRSEVLGQGDRRETDWSLGSRRPTRDRVEPWDKETDERRSGALGQGDRRETERSLGTRRPTRDGVGPWDKETDVCSRLLASTPSGEKAFR